jgi:hypothetical protein
VVRAPAHRFITAFVAFIIVVVVIIVVVGGGGVVVVLTPRVMREGWVYK